MPIPHTSPENSRAVAARLLLPALLAGGLFAAVLFATTLAQAQGAKKSKSSGGHAGPKGGHAAAKGMAPPGSSGFGPGAGPGVNVERRKAKDRDSKTPEPVDTENVPKGYHVPPEPPDALTTTEEWKEDPFTKRKPLQQGTILNNYRTILQTGVFTGDDQKKLVADVVRWRLSLLTRKEFREQTHIKLRDILQDISNFPGPQNKNNREVRKFVLQTIADEAPKLFKYHAVARINGAMLLAELSDPAYNEADGDNRKPPEPCVRAIKPLTELVNDKEQLVAPRIWGVNGLVRLAALPEMKPAQRGEIVDTLVNLLNKSADEHEWYQWRLVEGLGRLNIVQDLNKRPIVPQALALVLHDRNRPWRVRSEAALSLGRLSYTLEINAGLLAYEIALLAQQMSESDDFGDNPKQASWKLCFLKLYGAFKPIDEEQKRGLLTQTERGPLASYRRVVQESFDVVYPVVRKVVNEQEEMDTVLANLRKWIDANVPQNPRIHPDEEPILSEKPIVKKPDGAAGPRGAADPPSTTANGNGGR